MSEQPQVQQVEPVDRSGTAVAGFLHVVAIAVLVLGTGAAVVVAFSVGALPGLLVAVAVWIGGGLLMGVSEAVRLLAHRG